MPLNKLDNFLKNVEGRILYVSPSDLDSSDNITNEGNSQTRPFKTLQRALIEAARFSYQIGNNNDLVEKTTILLMPGEHLIDNRPGYGILNDGGAKALTPGGSTVNASVFDLTLDSNFDLNQENNILYKYNSVHGGVIVPRGTSVVGLDLRKTKIRPKYVPNPTDDTPNSAIFRITGGCYFWQFSIFDGDENNQVYINSSDTERPTFSHHKLTCFEYADGINKYGRTGIDDLNMYYYKLSVAYDAASTRNIQDKYPSNPEGFASRRPEYEIVGAFAPDPIKISKIFAGREGGFADSIVTVRTLTDHNLDVGTPIKINGVVPADYNVSATVTSISATNPKEFTYTFAKFNAAIQTPAGNVTSATVTVETDTVQGASPYIFNCSLRSVYGMNGMKADGAKATGFKSMVVAQFTGVSLQKDDRAFVKYNKTSRSYEGINIEPTSGSALAQDSSSTNPAEVYHLDSNAIYRQGWETTHVSIINDAILQIVSVFAIGYNKHFYADTGGDASITNSNSNFGQFALIAEGFKKEAFEKDDTSYLTHLITPQAINSAEENIDWLRIDVNKLDTVLQDKLYLYGFNKKDIKPPSLTQGYRIGAKKNDVLYLQQEQGGDVFQATITMLDEGLGHTTVSAKEYSISSPSNNIFASTVTHKLITGEKVLIRSLSGDLPVNIEEDTVYYVIRMGGNTTEFKLASSLSNAVLGDPITVYGGSDLTLLSRVTDKESGDKGHPIQWDEGNSNWYICINGIAGGEDPSTLYTKVKAMKDAYAADTNNPKIAPDKTEPTYVKRIEDNRSIDDKIYKLRLTIPSETLIAKNPENGFILQESTKTSNRTVNDFISTDDLGRDDYDYARNLRYIRGGSYSTGTQRVTIDADRSHNLKVGDTITIKDVKSSDNTTGAKDAGYNGTFTVDTVPDNMSFTYKPGRTDPTPGTTATNPFSGKIGVDDLTVSYPRFERIDMQSNVYLYRNEILSSYNNDDNSDGIYHAYPLNANNKCPADEKGFGEYEYSQNVVNLYPQLDRDNNNDNPKSAKSKAVSQPLGNVATNYPERSLTRETIDKLNVSLGIGKVTDTITYNTNSSLITFSKDHNLKGLMKGTLVGGSSYTAGTYYNVKILSGSSTGTWHGTLATVTVNDAGQVTVVDITNPGSNFPVGTGYFENVLGSGNGATYTVASSELGNSDNLTLQFTGSDSTDDLYYRISSVTTGSQVAIATATGDTRPTPDQYGIIVGPSIQANCNFITDDGVEKAVFTTLNSIPHGLVKGNKIQFNSPENVNGGELVVESVGGQSGQNVTTKFITKTRPSLSGSQLTNGWILKHGLSSNDEVSLSGNENLSARGVEIFNNEVGIGTVTTYNGDDVLQITLLNSKIGISERFKRGSYIQIGDEIVRVKSSEVVQVGGVDSLKILRGVLGTQKQDHDGGLLIRSIRPIPVEFHRPSILRASGHTFEYLGYGPGNYSTALPQVQVKTLTEEEEFLSQSQERSCGAVVYTGMNNKGDFYVGNQKKSALTGEEVTFDTPIPTIAGEDPARLSVVFDEVTIKERLVVEGGKSKTSLTEFSGPVTFSETSDIQIKSDLRLKSETQSESTSTGALQVEGGVGIKKNLWVGGTLNVGGDTTLKKTTITGDLTIDASSGTIKVGSLTKDRVVLAGTGGELVDSANLTFDGSKLRLPDDIELQFGTAGANDDTTNGDLRIFHDGESKIWDNGTGGLVLQSASSPIELRAISQPDNEVMLKASPGGSVEIYHDGTKAFETIVDGSAKGVKITGFLDVTQDITAFWTSSDKNLKDNISPITKALDKVKSLSGNTFNWNENSRDEGKADVGVIAQEVDALGLPGIIQDKENGFKSVQYHKLVPVLIEAVKELSAKVEKLEQHISDK